jgi:hypothetical protein
VKDRANAPALREKVRGDGDQLLICSRFSCAQAALLRRPSNCSSMFFMAPKIPNACSTITRGVGPTDASEPSACVLGRGELGDRRLCSSHLVPCQAKFALSSNGT